MKTKEDIPVSAAAATVAIMPTTDFRATPFPGGPEFSFRGGIMSSPVPAEFAQRMLDEGKIEKNTAADIG